jgi:hypothetical protein
MGLRFQLRPNRGILEKNVRIAERFFDTPYKPISAVRGGFFIANGSVNRAAPIS